MSDDLSTALIGIHQTNKTTNVCVFGLNVDCDDTLVCPVNTWRSSLEIAGTPSAAAAEAAQVAQGQVIPCDRLRVPIPPNTCKATCTPPMPCPMIGGQTAIGPAEFWGNHNLDTNFEWAPLSCRYNLDAFRNATYEQIRLLPEAKSTTNPEDYNRALEAYCFTASAQDCPNDLTTNARMPMCSRAASTGLGGQICKDWLSSLSAPVRDNFFINYCTNNITPDCLCEDPRPRDVFTLLNAGIGLTGSPQCWWIPCKIQTGAYLIPSRYEVKGNCPQQITVCENVVNFINSTVEDVDINIVRNYTGCGAGEGDGILSRYWWVIAIVVALIVIGIILYFLFFRRR